MYAILFVNYTSIRLWPPHAKSWLIGKDSDAGDLGAGGEGDNRGWDGWMASPTWTWVWVNSRSWWWTGRPGVLRFMGLQGVRHDWATELTDVKVVYFHPAYFTYYQSILCWNAGLDEAQLESRLLGKISITLDMQMTPPLLQNVKRN